MITSITHCEIIQFNLAVFLNPLKFSWKISRNVNLLISKKEVHKTQKGERSILNHFFRSSRSSDQASHSTLSYFWISLRSSICLCNSVPRKFFPSSVICGFLFRLYVGGTNVEKCAENICEAFKANFSRYLLNVYFNI